MNRRHHKWRQRGWNPFAALLRHFELTAEERLRGCGAKTNDHGGLKGLDFSFNPWLARGDLHRIWFLLNAPFSARLPFEMFDGVRNICLFPIDARFYQCFIENSAGRSDKRPSLKVLLISGLLTDKH